MPMNKPFRRYGRGEEAYNNKAVYSLILNDDLLEKTMCALSGKKINTSSNQYILFLFQSFFSSCECEVLLLGLRILFSFATFRLVECHFFVEYG